MAPWPRCPLPLFPLGLVLYPGVMLPLHIFEERYRRLVRDLLDMQDGSRLFGVVAIKAGREVGTDGITALHEIGCTAELRYAEAYEDGRFDIIVTGMPTVPADRGGGVRADAGRSSTAAGRQSTDGPRRWPTRVGRLFGSYREALLTAQGMPDDDDDAPELPDDPANWPTSSPHR